MGTRRVGRMMGTDRLEGGVACIITNVDDVVERCRFRDDARASVHCATLVSTNKTLNRLIPRVGV